MKETPNIHIWIHIVYIKRHNIYIQIFIKQEQMATSKHAVASGKAGHVQTPNKSASIVSRAASNGPCIESLIVL